MIIYCESREITNDELDSIISNSPKLRAFVDGEVFEHIHAKLHLHNNILIKDFGKPAIIKSKGKKKKGSKHKKRMHDRDISYADIHLRLENKSATAASKKDHGNGVYSGVAEINKSGLSPEIMRDGASVTITELRYSGNWDIVAICYFLWGIGYKFAWARMKDLPCTDNFKIPQPDRRDFIMSSVPVHYPPQFPFYDDIETVLKLIIEDEVYMLEERVNGFKPTITIWDAFSLPIK